MYSIAKILRRSRSLNVTPCSFTALSTKLVEVTSGSNKERVLKPSGLVYNNNSLRLYSTRDVFSRFLGINKLSSIADTNHKEDEVEKVEEDDDDSLFDSELGNEVAASDDDLVEHSNVAKSKGKRVYCELYESIVKKSVKQALEVWVKEGKELTQTEVSLTLHNLRKRKSYDTSLQLLEWLKANTKFEFTESNYASHLDLIAKLHSLQKAENFLEEIPEALRGEVVYRTLLANCVRKSNLKKSEDLFNKMKDELNFPISVFACNQLILVYSKCGMFSKISNVLLLMEKENVKPTRGTYTFLINSKGLAKDITGMDEVVETMKDEGIELDVEIQGTVAKFYIRAGFKERATEVMKEIEGKGLKETPWVCLLLLPLYAEMGDVENVRRLSKFVEETLRFDNCISAIKAWGKVKEIEEAESIFEKLVEKYKIFPMRPYFALMEIYINNKMLEKGKDLVKRLANSGIVVGQATWHSLVKLYVKAGQVGKAEEILNNATKGNKIKPMFNSYMVILEEYARRGDVHNAEKVFMRMKSVGYGAQFKQYETVLNAYINSKIVAYGMKERMKVDNVYPNKTLVAKLIQVDPFRKSPVSVLLDE